jgi:AraC-like DNA-binding protein
MRSASLGHGQAEIRRSIARELGAFLRGTRVRKVIFADASLRPPMLAYVTGFPRLTLPLAGRHSMEIARRARVVRVAPARGQAVFVPRDSWDRPDWTRPAKVLTILFGKRQIGVSLVTHDGRRGEPGAALKAALGPPEGLTQGVLGALGALSAPQRDGPLGRLLTESLLHACLQRLEAPVEAHPRKAAHTYDAIRLYAQENFQRPITRASVARAFGLTPNHVSRLFRREGGLRFCDHLTRVRIDQARFLLRESSSPLKEVAACCGYRDVAYFCRVFRRVTRTTPTGYRSKGR